MNLTKESAAWNILKLKEDVCFVLEVREQLHHVRTVLGLLRILVVVDESWLILNAAQPAQNVSLINDVIQYFHVIYFILRNDFHGDDALRSFVHCAKDLRVSTTTNQLVKHVILLSWLEGPEGPVLRYGGLGNATIWFSLLCR